MIRRFALKLGFGRLLAWVREAHEGKNRAKGFVDWLMEHAWLLGLVLGSIVGGLGIAYGQDSQAVSLTCGFAAAVLVPAGMLPAAWQENPAGLESHNWYKVLRNYSAEIGVAVMAWWEWATGGRCDAAGGVHLWRLTLSCGGATFILAMLAGFLAHLGLLSSAKLALPPVKAV